MFGAPWQLPVVSVCVFCFKRILQREAEIFEALPFHLRYFEVFREVFEVRESQGQLRQFSDKRDWPDRCDKDLTALHYPWWGQRFDWHPQPFGVHLLSKLRHHDHILHPGVQIKLYKKWLHLSKVPNSDVKHLTPHFLRLKNHVSGRKFLFSKIDCWGFFKGARGKHKPLDHKVSEINCAMKFIREILRIKTT